MVGLNREAAERYPVANKWLNHNFNSYLLRNKRIYPAFFKWANFGYYSPQRFPDPRYPRAADDPYPRFPDDMYTRRFFTYGNPPFFSLIKEGCDYNSDGTPKGFLYGQTWSVQKLGINARLLELLEQALNADPSSNDSKLMMEMVVGTMMHEMVHWSYYRSPKGDEKKKYGGDEEKGTTAFEMEAFGHPLALPLERVCPAKVFAYVGIETEVKIRMKPGGSDTLIEIKGVAPDGPAAKAGIKKADLIRKFDGDDIWGGADGFDRQLQSKKPGQVIKIVIKRGKQTLTVNLKLETRTSGK